MSLSLSTEYIDFLQNIKTQIVYSRNVALLKVNEELINLYFLIGKNIAEKQKETLWGDDLIGQIEKDIKQEFPDIKGFSRTNLFYMKKFFLFFPESEFVPQPVGQIPWGHIRLLLDRTKIQQEAIFYAEKTKKKSWSRVLLEHQIELNLYERQGKLLSNFETKIVENEKNLVQEHFKESYLLDFLQLSEEAKEKDLEKLLIKNISRFLLELGTGFAFVGEQYKLTVGGQEFFVDLLFYNYILKRFVVVALKTTAFKPEHIGQIGFYISAIDNDIKTEEDKSTIGLIICKTKNKTVVEYALKNAVHPTGVAEYKLLSELPSEISKFLPSLDDMEYAINQ